MKKALVNKVFDKTITDSFMNPDIQSAVHELIGKKCCRQSVGEFKSLTLGFGKKTESKNAPLGYRGEWEILTYYSGWRVIYGGQILCAGGDGEESYDLNKILGRIELTCISSIEPKELDVRLLFDNKVVVDILALNHASDSDIVDIFCPQNRIISFGFKTGWKIENETH